MEQTLIAVLEKRKTDFRGGFIKQNEVALLIDAFKYVLYSFEIINTLLPYSIIGQKFILSKDIDKSKYGVDMEWLSPQDQIDEAFDFYPGIVAVKNNFLPVGSCCAGSGNPYFIRRQGDEWCVYRILHDMITDESLAEGGIEYIETLSCFISNAVIQ